MLTLRLLAALLLAGVLKDALDGRLAPPAPLAWSVAFFTCGVIFVVARSRTSLQRALLVTAGGAVIAGALTWMALPR